MRRNHEPLRVQANPELSDGGSTLASPKSKKEISPKALAYAQHHIADVLKRLPDTHLLTPKFIKEVIKANFEYLNYAAMAVPHIKSGQASFISTFGSARSNHLATLEKRHATFSKSAVLLARLTGQRNHRDINYFPKNFKPKALVKLSKELDKYREDPSRTPIDLITTVEQVISSVANSRSPKLTSGVCRSTPFVLKDLSIQLNKHKGYELARQIGEIVRERGHLAANGAGPGAMMGNSQGANPEQELDAPVLGIAVMIPSESGNPFVPGSGPGHEAAVAADSSKLHRSEHETFPFRKWGLIHESDGLIVTPGGFGTLEEFLEVLSLIEGSNIDQPVAFVDKSFFNPIISALTEAGFITKELAERIVVTDSPEEAVDHIQNFYKNEQGELVFPERWGIHTKEHELNRDYFTKRVKIEEQDVASFAFPEVNHSQRPKNFQTYIAALIEVANAQYEECAAACPHADQITPEMTGAFVKFLIDHVHVSAQCAKAGIKNPVLLLGSQNREEFDKIKTQLTANGESVISKVGDSDHNRIGVTISKWKDSVALASRYHSVSLEAATPNCQKIIIADGGVKALHRFFQYLCWKQTGKLPKETPLIVIDPEGRFQKTFHKICERTEAYGGTSSHERKLAEFFPSLDAAGEKYPELVNKPSANA